mmetsp:Transcript_19831/g.35883  ORF Transcript_19831/g.35883 Transcript_19831/m.35883 type:complete len:85 (-) Transcript_19831:212-466(-)
MRACRCFCIESLCYPKKEMRGEDWGENVLSALSFSEYKPLFNTTYDSTRKLSNGEFGGAIIQLLSDDKCMGSHLNQDRIFIESR